MVRTRMLVLLGVLFLSTSAFACEDEPQIEMKQTGPQVKVIKKERRIEYISMRGAAKLDREQARMDAKLAKKARIQLVQNNRAPASAR